MKKSVLVFLVASLAIACVEQAPELSAAEREQLRENISREAPHPQHELDINFENRVRLIGYDVSTETVTPGQAFTITWYWHAQRQLDGGWQIFTHLADGRGENRVNEDTNGVVRQLYQPGRWREGEYIEDPQTITLPADWGSDQVVFYLGLWNGPHRLSISRGPSDGENRARAAQLSVATGPTAQAAPERPATPPPSIRAQHATGGVRIDGRLDDAAWQVPASTGFVNTVTGATGDVRATVRTLWDAQKLYVAFEVDDTFLRNTLEGRDAHLWEQDAVEIMVDPDGDGRNYFELQVSPTGEVFDTRYDSRRVPGPIGHADWNAAIEASVATRGTANDDADDEGYSVEIAIPWSSFVAPDGSAMSAPPSESTWRMNFYVMDTTRSGSRSSGWSPTLERDFHVPARFGRVTFAPAPVAAAEPAAEAAPAPTARAIQISPEAQRQLQRAIAAGSRPSAEAVRRHGLEPLPQQ
ncbi:carbohydrate-binding family 9-like protein [Sandaracinus amylolyticus]|uniref:carbohydrate-binding family 9-like protein n=1 Tax=Sandaracinus amylolyticus TaxID=927083 RepID=UPI001F3BFEBE|nr:carbohydrate-binding family 9-like protein [Sandaracinus amylolyticus]UJR81016.1 Hypothetical protein I5071_30670 [Sandaracinus amylolyticus]